MATFNAKLRIAVLILAMSSLALVVLASRPARAAGSWYVAPGGDDSNSCLSTSDPCATIGAAIGKASSGDSVYVASGTYTSSTGSGVVTLDKNVSLSGGWDQTFNTQTGTSTIDGQGARRGIEVISSTVTVENFVIQNGFNSGHGGGVYNYTGALTLTNTVVRNNISQSTGGGIYNDGSLTLNNTVVSGNRAGDTCCSGGNGGGGIQNMVGTLTLNNSVVSGNQILGDFQGSGIDSFATVILNNSTVSGNRGSKDAIYSLSGTAYLNSSTVADNQGNGFTNYVGMAYLQNTILANNTGLDCVNHTGGSGEAVTSLGYNLIQSQNGCTMLSSDLIGMDPQLSPLHNNNGSTLTHALLPNSPAVNAGNPNGCQGNAGLLPTDQRGFARYGRCDIGAYELQPVGFSTKTVSPSVVLHGNPLTYTITLRNGGALDVTNVLVTDTLPSSLDFISNSLTATSGTANHANRVITWSGPVSASSVVTITYGARTNQTVAMSAVISNTAVIDNQVEIFRRTATLNVRPSQALLPLVIKPTSGIFGRVNQKGLPAAGVSLELRFYNGSSWFTLMTSTTDADGNYAFTSLPSLRTGQIYYVRYINPATIANDRLSAWFTPQLTSFGGGDTVYMSDFDLADVALSSPGPNASVGLPTTFKWKLRPYTPSDSYQLELFDPDGSSDFITPLLGYVDRYTLDDLPAGFSIGGSYGWAVWVNSPDGGGGASFYYNPVSFSRRGLNLEQVLPAGEQRNLADLLEKIFWRKDR